MAKAPTSGKSTNSSIITGDDCIIFISTNGWRPPLLCENITVTNCRLSASANAIKFGEGNAKGIQHVVIGNCVITDDSSGFSFAVADGGFVNDVLIWLSHHSRARDRRKAVAAATARIMKGCPCWVRVVPGEWNET
jgi:hypothetical protein